MSIQIINRAMFKLGQNPLSSTNEAPHGSMAGIVYENCRDDLLSSHPWRFAIKRAELAPDDDTPKFGFKHQYTIPSDCLFFIDIGTSFKSPNLSKVILQDDSRYHIEAGKILTNENTKLYVRYVARIEDDTTYSHLFKEALACHIAAEMCLRITGNLQLKTQLEQELQIWLTKAEQNNEFVCDAITMPDNSWLTSRVDWRSATDAKD